MGVCGLISDGSNFCPVVSATGLFYVLTPCFNYNCTTLVFQIQDMFVRPLWGLFEIKEKVMVDVTVTRGGVTGHIRWDRNIAGIDAPHSCCRGNCGACVCKLKKGEVRLSRNFCSR